MQGPTEYLSQVEVGLRLKLTTRQGRKLTRLGMPREPDRAGRGRKGRFATYPWPATLAWYLAFKDSERAVRAAACSRRRSASAARRESRISSSEAP